MTAWEATTSTTPTVTRTPTRAGRQSTPTSGMITKAAAVSAVPNCTRPGLDELKALPDRMTRWVPSET
jgi:hypothetical protein